MAMDIPGGAQPGMGHPGFTPEYKPDIGASFAPYSPPGGAAPGQSWSDIWKGVVGNPAFLPTIGTLALVGALSGRKKGGGGASLLMLPMLMQMMPRMAGGTAPVAATPAPPAPPPLPTTT